MLGKVEGKVEAAELIEIRSTGSLEGNLTTAQLVIEKGGYYQGTVRQTVKPTVTSES